MNFHEQLSNQEQSSILNEDDIKELIENRNILPEDHRIIEELSQLPKSIFLEFHNFFQAKKKDLLSPWSTCLKIQIMKKRKKKIFGIIFGFIEKIRLDSLLEYKSSF